MTAKLWPALLAVALLVATPLVADRFLVILLGQVFYLAVMALSLDLVWGYAGVLSLGQAIFFGAGAYAMGLVQQRLHIPAADWLGLLLALLLGGSLAWALALAAFSSAIDGVRFAVITLALALLAEFVAGEWRSLTGGYNGLFGLRGFGFGLGLELGPTAAFYLAATVLVLSYALCRAVVGSGLGRVFMAIRDHELRTAFLGYNLTRYRAAAMGLGGALAGLGGAFYATHVGYVSPQVMGFQIATEAAVWVILGGRGTLVGPVLGALVVNLLRMLLSARLQHVWLGILGALVVVVILGFPQGIWSFLRRWLAAWALPAVASRAKVRIVELPAAAVGPAAGDRPLLRVVGLHKRFGPLAVARDLNLSYRAGEVACLIGPNGAGKTTFVNLVTGALAADAGEVFLRGERITRLSPDRITRGGIARKFQVPSVFSGLTVGENLQVAGDSRRQGFWRLLRARRDLEIDRDAWALLNVAGLHRRLQDPAGWLSHGEKQWLELAMVVSLRTPLVLLDEPTAGMARSDVEQVAAAVRSICARRGTTFVIVEHDMDFVRTVANRVTVLHRGMVLSDGSVARVQADPAVQEVYLGAVGCPS